MSRPAGYPDGPFLRTGLAVRHPTTESAAVMYSLIGSCKLNGIEPETWLRHEISVINTWPANCVKELLLCKGSVWETELLYVRSIF